MTTGEGGLVSGHTLHNVCRTRAVRVESATREAIVQEDSTGLCGGISNLFLCKGEPGKVLKIEVKCIIDHFDQDNDHLIIDEDVLEERQALAPFDQLVQPRQI